MGKTSISRAVASTEPTHIYHACGYIDEGGPGFPCTNPVQLGKHCEGHTRPTEQKTADAGAVCQCPVRIAIRLFLSGLAPASLGRQMYFLKDRTELESALSTPCPCCAERDEAIRTRTLAQEASTRDLEAKRAAEAEKDRLGLSFCALEAQYETACQIIREERPQAEQFRSDLAEALAALQNIRKFPALPFPDPLAHSWRAFGEAVYRSYCDIQRVAAALVHKENHHAD